MKTYFCLYCKKRLIEDGQKYLCQNCKEKFFSCQNKPILINESKSLFKVKNITKNKVTFSTKERTKTYKSASSFLKKLRTNSQSIKNFQKYAGKFENKKTAKVLIIGSGTGSEGQKILSGVKNIQLFTSDIYFYPTIDIICDAHILPFPNNYFDGIVAQAIIEHLQNPEIAVKEFHRVLKRNGWAYFETPFMQQTHGGDYDFKRYTFNGHKLLLKDFRKIEGGVLSGPLISLVWSWAYFVSSFFNNKRLQSYIRTFIFTSLFWLKYFDRFLRNKNALDSANSFYFFAKK